MLTLAALLAVAEPARAAESPIAIERRTASPEGAVATESSQVLPKWTPAVGVSLTQDAGLVRAGSAQLLSRTRGDVTFAFGLFDRLELSGDLPLMIRQKLGYRSSSGAGEVAASGIGDVRAGLKGTILRLPRRGIGLGVMFDVTAPTGRASDHLGVGAPSYAPQLLLELRGPRAIRAAFNLGYLVRNDVRALGRIAGDEITTRAAVRVPLSWRRSIALVGEIDGRIALVRGASSGLLARLGLRGQTRSGVVVGAYVHGGPPIDFGSAQIGGTLAFAWAPPGRMGTERAFDGNERPHASTYALRHDALARRDEPEPSKPDPRDLDGDRVFASGDACPNAAEDRDGFEDDDGCPELDDDRDGFADAFDLCPHAPELINGLLDLDGCPDRRGKDGAAETVASIDLAALAPRIAFEPGSDVLTADSRTSIEQWVELARLNPWMERLELAVYVHTSGDAAADRARAETRASAVQAAARTVGLEDWRIHVRELGAIPAELDERVRVAVIGTSDALRPLAPEPAALQRWIAEASRPAALAPTAPKSIPADGIDYAAQGPAAKSKKP